MNLDRVDGYSPAVGGGTLFWFGAKNTVARESPEVVDALVYRAGERLFA